MTNYEPRRIFRRPSMLDPRVAEEIPGGVDPAVRSDLAHSTAQILLHQGRATEDPDVIDRLLTLVDTEGIDAIATLWASSPAQTLPGALWRIYLIREWLRCDPRTMADRYRLGVTSAQVAGVIAGLTPPPSPEDVLRLADDVLSGVFVGELDMALERASALCRVLAAGAALDADWIEMTDEDLAGRVTKRAGSLLTTAEELADEAKMWRQGRLE